ncbi:MAG: glutaminase A [Leptolyngbyaceae cyanobacterium bins.59]|nr:glutaminase A [Leptolyngbyaceae cyanobacterium bins.59]
MSQLKGLAALSESLLEQWVIQVQAKIQNGQLPHYIPLLQNVEPHQVIVQVRSTTGLVCSVGNPKHPFVLMSVIKPFLLLFLLEHLGPEEVFRRVGRLPSDQPFNSLIQLDIDNGWPRNPMINSGAIALAALLPGDTSDAQCESLQRWLNERSGAHLKLDQAMLTSVRLAGGHRNREIAALLARYSSLSDQETTLDVYNQICCLAGTIEDLSRLGLLLTQANPSIRPRHRQIVNALMLTCGLYERSGLFATQIGLPSKSGVSGALLSIVPGEGAIACYAPTLDEVGNSIAGLLLVEQMAETLELSVFS